MQLAHLPRLAIALLAMTLGAGIGPAAAQSYPSNTIRIVLGGGAGTPPDIITRIVANELGQSEGWRIVVENKPGAMRRRLQPVRCSSSRPTGIRSSLLRWAPRRHLHYCRTSVFDTTATLLRSSKSCPRIMSWSPIRWYPPSRWRSLSTSRGANLTSSPSRQVASAHRPISRVSSSSFRRACASPTSPTGRCRRRLATSSTAPTTTSSLRHCRCLTSLPNGKLRALAVTGPERMTALKDVPSVVEAGFPELIIQDWFGYVVKNGTPDVIVARLNEAINKALTKPSVREAFAKIAAEPAGGSPSEFGAHITSQMAHWAKVVKDAGIKIRE